MEASQRPAAPLAACAGLKGRLIPVDFYPPWEKPFLFLELAVIKLILMNIPGFTRDRLGPST